MVSDLVAAAAGALDAHAGLVVGGADLDGPAQMAQDEGLRLGGDAVVDLVGVLAQHALRPPVGHRAAAVGVDADSERRHHTLLIRALRPWLVYTRSRRSRSPRPDTSRSASPPPAVRAYPER